MPGRALATSMSCSAERLIDRVQPAREISLSSSTVAICDTVHSPCGLEVTAFGLIALDGFEEGFNVAGPESARVLALDDFRKDGRASHHGLGEDLHQVAPLVAVYQDVEFAKRLRVFVEIADPLLEGAVVAVVRPQELIAFG